MMLFVDSGVYLGDQYSRSPVGFQLTGPEGEREGTVQQLAKRERAQLIRRRPRSGSGDDILIRRGCGRCGRCQPILFGHKPLLPLCEFIGALQRMPAQLPAYLSDHLTQCRGHM